MIRAEVFNYFKIQWLKTGDCASLKSYNPNKTFFQSRIYINLKFQTCFKTHLHERHHPLRICDQSSCDPDGCDVTTLDLESSGQGRLSRGFICDRECTKNYDMDGWFIFDEMSTV